MKRRNRAKQTTSLHDRLAKEAARLKEKAHRACNAEEEARLMKKLHLIEEAAEMEELLSLRPPDQQRTT